MKTYWQEVKNPGSKVKNWYLMAVVGNVTKSVAYVEKWNDSRSTTNPFKVCFLDVEADKFMPTAAFWPWNKVKIEEGKSPGGYFIDYYGDLAKAKEYAEKNYALDNSRKFVGA